MIMFGGEKKHFVKEKKILSEFGLVEHVGPIGSGHAMKALNNYVSAAGLISSFQAIATAEKFGIKQKIFQKVINSSTGKNNTTEVKIDKFVIPKRFNSGFALKLMTKDIQIANNMIKKFNFDTPLTKGVINSLIDGLDSLGEFADHTELYNYIVKKN